MERWKVRTCWSSSVFEGEILSSHDWRFAPVMVMDSKMRFLLGYIHDFATKEQFRKDR